MALIGQLIVGWNLDRKALAHDLPGTHSGNRDLEKAYEQGKIRALGVSNYDTNRILDICTFAFVKPMVNQVETHVYWQQRENHQVMQELGVAHEAWAPFAEGANGFFNNPTLSAIAQKYNRIVAQVALRYLMDLGVIVIPKSTHKERMLQNRHKACKWWLLLAGDGTIPTEGKKLCSI